MSIFEYDEEKEMRLIREAEYGYGFDDGIEAGKAEGLANIVAMIRKKRQKGLEVAEIADILELDEALISQVSCILDKNVELTDLEIAKKVLQC